MGTTDGSTSYWLDFFINAGVPASDATSYAITFSENRIKEEMLSDLNKEILNDMGIKLMGDIIAILKYAKDKVSQATRSKALEGVSVTAPNKPSPTTSRLTNEANRTLMHHLRKAVESHTETPPPAGELSSSLAARLGPKNVQPAPKPQIVRLAQSSQKLEVPVPKKRRVLPEHEGGYKVTLPQGTTPKTKKIIEGSHLNVPARQKAVSSSVFDRLGDSNEGTDSDDAVTMQSASGKVTITGLGNVQLKKKLAPKTQNSIQERLGPAKAQKRTATCSMDDFMDIEVEQTTSTLPYQGILKLSSAKRRLIQEEKKKESERKRQDELKKAALFKKAQEAKRITSGILSPDAVDIKVPVSARLGSQTPVKAPAHSTTPATKKVKVTTAATTPAGGVFSRLGRKL